MQGECYSYNVPLFICVRYLYSFKMNYKHIMDQFSNNKKTDINLHLWITHIILSSVSTSYRSL